MINIQAGRLLILDDDPAIGTVIATIAGHLGFETKVTSIAEDFISTVSGWEPTHVIVDLKMPHVDGIEILNYMATINSNAIVIVMSGVDDRVIEAAARAAAENGLRVGGVLRKPFTPKQLRALLASDLPAQNQVLREKDSSGLPLQIDEAQLKFAITSSQLEPFFQPKVHCTTAAVSGFEALARWRHPKIGLIMPDQFIAISEQTGLIMELSRQIISKSLIWFAKSFGSSHLRISLNLSAKVLSDVEFFPWLVRQCEHVSLSPEKVVLEITETAATENHVRMIELLTQARILGFGLSLDDFGLGYSSLAQLARLPFSEIKIDKMFVMSARMSSESQKIATAIVGLGQALELRITAEGVEDEWTLEFLRKTRCNYAQGYLIGRPMEGAAALAWVDDYRRVKGTV